MGKILRIFISKVVIEKWEKFNSMVSYYNNGSVYFFGEMGFFFIVDLEYNFWFLNFSENFIFLF